MNMVRTDAAYLKFVDARDKLIAYEKSHGNQSRSERLNDKEYQDLYNTFKFADKAGAEAEFCVNG